MSTVIRTQQDILKVQGSDAYYVRSDSKPDLFYRVEFKASCECPHHQYRGLICKHIKQVERQVEAKAKARQVKNK